jgi:type III secretory pathway lipoprotein EscJ
MMGCDEQIIHDLGEAEANRVVSRLSVAALDAHKVQQSDGRWAVAVPEESILPALTFLESNRVLTPRGQPSGSSKGGLVPSRQEQWFRYERAMAQAIEESLAALAGVLEARVHVNLPESDPLFGTKKREGGSGSVLLLVDGGFVASNDEISALVAGAAGIPAQHVTVLKSVAPQRNTELGRGVPVDASSSSAAAEVGQQSSGVAPDSEGAGLVTELLAAAAGVLVALGAQVLWRRRDPPLRFRRLDGKDVEA